MDRMYSNDIQGFPQLQNFEIIPSEASVPAIYIDAVYVQPFSLLPLVAQLGLISSSLVG